jgi:glutamate N-acetyltransferase/amino-acid N-acetyltransferase
LIEVDVRGANSDGDARQIAHTVACSNQVKSAVFGCDPNWGRIVSAAGYSGVPIDISRLELQLNGLLLFQCGEPVAFDAKTASQSIRDNHLTHIQLIVGDGPGQCRHWTSDLTLDYVRFNSEYTT